jgi:TPR repeat protein
MFTYSTPARAKEEQMTIARYNYLKGQTNLDHFSKYGVNVELWKDTVVAVWRVPAKYKVAAAVLTEAQYEDGVFLFEGEPGWTKYDGVLTVGFEVHINYRPVVAETRVQDSRNAAKFMKDVMDMRQECINSACHTAKSRLETFKNQVRAAYYTKRMEECQKSTDIYIG